MRVLVLGIILRNEIGMLYAINQAQKWHSFDKDPPFYSTSDYWSIPVLLKNEKIGEVIVGKVARYKQNHEYCHEKPEHDTYLLAHFNKFFHQ
jgi:hypothetical protein